MSYESNRKWRLANPEKRYADKARYYTRMRKGATNTGRRWKGEDVELILNSPLTDRELSRQLGRSVEAIQVKRAKVAGVIS